jgi:hypothetical protein
MQGLAGGNTAVVPDWIGMITVSSSFQETGMDQIWVYYAVIIKSHIIKGMQVCSLQ